MPQNDNFRARVAMLVLVILALVGMLVGACAPQKRPDGTFPKPESIAEYNRKRQRQQQPRTPILELNRLRCMGGGLGGCSSWLLR